MVALSFPSIYLLVGPVGPIGQEVVLPGEVAGVAIGLAVNESRTVAVAGAVDGRRDSLVDREDVLAVDRHRRDIVALGAISDVIARERSLLGGGDGVLVVLTD